MPKLYSSIKKPAWLQSSAPLTQPPGKSLGKYPDAADEIFGEIGENQSFDEPSSLMTKLIDLRVALNFEARGCARAHARAC